MSTVDKMLIKGIRSFDPENKHVITFFRPLTLIVGPNGAGKTTIIECLKLSCTGELPPNARSGHSFIHDPKVAGETETKGQIKLRFKTAAGKDVVCIRSFQLTQKASKMEYKAIESVLQTINPHTGEKVCLSYRCADMDREIPALMGVSKAILENVIFVHQDEANWPLQDSSTLKKKFDDIFSATRYTKALEVIKKLHKEQAQEIKTYKLKLEHLQTLKDAAYKGQTFSDVVGSPYYVAPEVLCKNYGPEVDVWSAGVILYILLSGVPPFWAETESGIFRQILRGKVDFESEPWPSISDSAKDLIKKMLERDPKKRISAHEVLCNPWIVDDRVAPDKPLDSAVLSRLKQFSAMHKLKKMALRVIAERLSEEEIGGLKELFNMIDTDNSGTITFEELKEGLKRVGSELMESEIKSLMDAADIDNSGSIDYGEFLAATLHLNKMDREENLIAAFSFFDKDSSGYITIDELQQACKEFGLGDVHLDDLIKDIDQDNDGRIDYGEFAAMMRKGDEGVGRNRTMRGNLNFNLAEAFVVNEPK